VIATGRTTPDTAERDGQCLSIPDADFYTLSFGMHEGPTYSRADLESVNWTTRSRSDLMRRERVLRTVMLTLVAIALVACSSGGQATADPATSASLSPTASPSLSPSPSSEPIPPTANLQPQIPPLDSVSEDSAVDPLNRFYNIAILNFDLPPGSQLEQFQFLAREGWEFFDRRNYSCVTTYLQADGERVAQMVFRTTRGQSYAGINDKFGNEQPEALSVCALPTTATEPAGETETKPAGLTDSVVEFVVDGQVVTTFTCPATSPLDADTWCEFEESEVGSNHFVVEIYWQDDLIVRIDIDRMTPNVQIVTS